MNHLRKLALATVAMAALISCVAVARAQQPPPQPVTITKIKDNVYWARGGAGSNDGIIAGQAIRPLLDPCRGTAASSTDMAGAAAKPDSDVRSALCSTRFAERRG